MIASLCKPIPELGDIIFKLFRSGKKIFEANKTFTMNRPNVCIVNIGIY